MPKKDVNRIANYVGPDLTAPEAKSTLCTLTYLSINFGSLHMYSKMTEFCFLCTQRLVHSPMMIVTEILLTWMIYYGRLR